MYIYDVQRIRRRALACRGRPERLLTNRSIQPQSKPRITVRSANQELRRRSGLGSCCANQGAARLGVLCT